MGVPGLLVAPEALFKVSGPHSEHHPSHSRQGSQILWPKGPDDGHRNGRLRMWSTNPHGHPQRAQARRVKLRNRPSRQLLGNEVWGWGVTGQS